jgi:hypothetical protein
VTQWKKKNFVQQLGHTVQLCNCRNHAEP